MLLEARNLQVHYGRLHALKGVSLEVAEGAIVTLIGSNGAGKSTTLRTVSGLKAPTNGEIWFQGQKIHGLPPQEIVKRGIAHVPEGRRVFPYMTVLENLKMGAYLRRDRGGVEKDLAYVYERFPVLAQRRNQKAGTLSGGEQQMLAVGRALMAKPKVLLMDEPSLGLSPIMVQEIAHIILTINQEGVSIVLVEQNARLALRLAQMAYVLEVGRIALQGPSQELLHNEHVIKAYLGG